MTNNTALTHLYCAANYDLNSLDISQNKALKYLGCELNKMTELDVSKNVNLVSLSCKYNSIKSLDLSQNLALRELWCNVNKLTFLDISKNTQLIREDTVIFYPDRTAAFDCSNNPDLFEICINSNQLNDTSFWYKGDLAKWNTTCDMKTGIEYICVEPSYKKMVKIFNPLGQELKPEQATEGLFIYQYSDGSTKKVMKQ